MDKHIPQSEKLKPRAHIGYLMGYDSTNIYRIWIPSQEKVVRTRDVTFDETLFYDPSELDIGHILQQDIPRVVEVLEEQPAEEEEEISAVETDYIDLLRPTSSVETSPAEAPHPMQQLLSLLSLRPLKSSCLRQSRPLIPRRPQLESKSYPLNSTPATSCQRAPSALELSPVERYTTLP